MYVQVSMLQMFLGTPIGGNEKITVDRLKQGLALMRFTIDEVRTGQLAKGKISARWCVSPEDFQLDPDCNPQPGLNSEDTDRSQDQRVRENGPENERSSS